MHFRKRKSAHFYGQSEHLFSRLELLEPSQPAPSDLRVSTLYDSHSSCTSNHNNPNAPRHHHTFDHRQPKKVGFKSTTTDKRSSSMCKKMKLIINNKPTTKQSKKGCTSMKTFKSLDSSFVCLPYSNPVSSRRTIKQTNPDF